MRVSSIGQLLADSGRPVINVDAGTCEWCDGPVAAGAGWALLGNNTRAWGGGRLTGDRCPVAHHPRACPAAERLAFDACFRRQIALILPDTPPEALAHWATSDDVVARVDVAIHPNTPPAVRARLADDPDPAVAAAVAAYHQATKET